MKKHFCIILVLFLVINSINAQLYPDLKNGKYGYVNKHGKVIIPHKYDEVSRYDLKGLFLVKRNNKKFVIDTLGGEYQFDNKISELINEEKEDNPNGRNIPYEINVYEYVGGLITSIKDGKYGYVDVNGKVIIPYIYDEAARFDYYGFYYVERDSIKYLVDTLGFEYPYANELSELTHMTLALDISNKKDLKEVPEEIFSYPQLKILILNYNEFITIPNSIKKLKNLVKLHMIGNRLEELPEEIGELKKLEHLYLMANKLKTLPPEIGALERLKRLMLFNNKIEYLPDEIGQLTRLKILSLGMNNLKKIPNTIVNLSSLINLELIRNEELEFAQVCDVLTKYPNEFILSIGEGRLEQDKKKLLILAPEQISLPKELWKIKNLIHLKIADADSTKIIPKEIEFLEKLKILDLRFNRIEKLPTEIANLKKLKSINLADNQMKRFPYEILNCEHLEELDLGGNSFVSVPKEIANLNKLKELSLFGNKIETLPVELFSLKKLISLHLAFNRLTTLPPELGNLCNLEELYLHENRINKLPPEIKKLVNLKIINLAVNPISDEEILMLEKVLPNCKIRLSWSIF